MKKIKIIIVASLTLMLGVTSCDFLDYQPDDFLTTDMIFSDVIRTQDWLASVYSAVPSPMWGYFKDHGWNVMGDDMTIPFEWTQFGWANVYNYTIGNWSPPSGWNPYYWVELPKRIRTGLLFIENVRPLPGTQQTEEEVELMKNEVRFLIAYYYTLMLEIYGPFPFRPNYLVPVDAPTSDLMMTQTPYDEIVEWCDNELLELSTKLPENYDSNLSKWGRATSIMALAVRARMLLFAASPLFNGNPDYEDWKNKDGNNLMNQSYDASKWAVAAAANKELIEAAHAAGHQLYKEYNDDSSIDAFMSYYNMSLKRYSEGNKEIIFGRPENMDLSWFHNHHLQKGVGGNAGLGVTQELVDAFYMSNGKVPILGYNEDGTPIIDPESGYKENGFSTAHDLKKTKWRGGGPATLKQGDLSPVTQTGVFNMYYDREPRFYVSVIFNEAWIPVQNRKTNFLQFGGMDTGFTFDAPQNGYNIRKRISLDVYPRENIHPYQPGIIYRLAEAYLSYAEALNESNPGHPDILTYINLVRERAGIPALQSGSSQDQISDIIKQERRIEFNCEGIRFHDVRRWKEGEKYLGGKLWGMNFSGRTKSDDPNNINAFYVRTFYKSRVFNKKQYLWPVPQAQIDINPNLVQAPGY